MSALPSMTVERARELLREQSASVAPKPATPAVRYCRCGHVLTAGVRIGPAMGELKRVLICWGCGYEDPSLYGRSTYERNGDRARILRGRRKGSAWL